MGSKVWLMMLLLLALAMVGNSTTLHGADDWGLPHTHLDEKSCIGGTCKVEDFTDTLLDSEANRRQLPQVPPNKYISYGALKSNTIPCNRRGDSYYNCDTKQRANPYTRGCSVITHCYRVYH